MSGAIDYRVGEPVDLGALDALFAAAWPRHAGADFATELAHSLSWVTAWDGARLVGYVKLAWDGSVHAFLLDTTVHPDYQRRGIGSELVRRAVAAARERGMEWVHVDYEPQLHGFYSGCGFVPTPAGLIRLS